MPAPVLELSGVQWAAREVSGPHEYLDEVVIVLGGVQAVIVPLIVGVMNAPSILAQERAMPVVQPIATSALPEFEAASIKPSASDSNLASSEESVGDWYASNSGGRLARTGGDDDAG